MFPRRAAIGDAEGFSFFSIDGSSFSGFTQPELR